MLSVLKRRGVAINCTASSSQSIFSDYNPVQRFKTTMAVRHVRTTAVAIGLNRVSKDVASLASRMTFEVFPTELAADCDVRFVALVLIGRELLTECSILGRVVAPK